MEKKMGMVFCRGCGKEIHETAPTCPNCGAPQDATPINSSNEIESVSDSWKRKFDLFEKAGGVKSSNLRKLSFQERMKVGFSIWAFLFGPFFYLVKGMWKKAISLSGVSVLVIIILEMVCMVLGIPDTITNVVFPAIFASRANVDYYKKVKLGDNGWW